VEWELATCLIVPVGVTRETIESIVANGVATDVKFIVAVTVPGFEEVKRPILIGLQVSSRMLGSDFRSVTVSPNDPKSVRELYELLSGLQYSRVVLVGVTGSRYLFPILLTVLLKIWKDRKSRVEILLLHGVEGERASLVPLVGFVAPALKISKVQKKVLRVVYGQTGAVSGKDLIERFGFRRSVYYVLADLERKGLLRVRRGRIEKTFTGSLYFSLLGEG